jgi:hypothetical protein
VHRLHLQPVRHQRGQVSPGQPRAPPTPRGLLRGPHRALRRAGSWRWRCRCATTGRVGASCCSSAPRGCCRPRWRRPCSAASTMCAAVIRPCAAWRTATTWSTRPCAPSSCPVRLCCCSTGPRSAACGAGGPRGVPSCMVVRPAGPAVRARPRRTSPRAPAAPTVHSPRRTSPRAPAARIVHFPHRVPPRAPVAWTVHSPRGASPRAPAAPTARPPTMLSPRPSRTGPRHLPAGGRAPRSQAGSARP